MPRDWKAELERNAAARRRRLEVMKQMAEYVYRLPPADRPYGQRGQYPKPPYYPKNADGLKPCRWCMTPTQRGWCGPECVAEFMRRAHWPTMARFITKRDKVCRLCGGQRPHVTEPLPYYQHTSDESWMGAAEWNRARADALKGLPDRRPMSCHLEYSFAVDHIVAVKDGGTDDPANLRLLCGRCHAEVSAAQAKRWAIERRAARVDESGQRGLEL